MRKKLSISDVGDKDGYHLQIDRTPWPDAARGTITIYGIYDGKPRVLRGPVPVSGGPMRGRDGALAQFVEIEGGWPSVGANDPKDPLRTVPLVPQSLEIDLEFDRDFPLNATAAGKRKAAAVANNRSR